MGVYIRQSTTVKKSGFTMAELMIAVGIIMLLTIAGFVTMQNQSRRARDQRRQSDLAQIRSALEMYRLTTPTRIYPPGAGMPHVVLADDLENFLPVIPQDPRQSSASRYYYSAAANGRTYVLCARLETQTPGGACGGINRCGSGGQCNIQLIQP